MVYISSWARLGIGDGSPDEDPGAIVQVLQDTSTYKAFLTAKGNHIELWGMNLDSPTGLLADIRLTDGGWNTILLAQDLNIRTGDFQGTSFDALFVKAMGGNDLVAASDFTDYVRGFTGNDYLAGYGGNDTLLGDAGNDTLHGGGESDILVGGAGKDLLTGSGGTDGMLFTSMAESGVTFAQRDVVNTFAHGDKIDVHLIDANAKVAGNQAFTFVQNFTGVAGQLQWDKTAATGYLVSGDVNGDAVADFSIQIYAAPTFGTIHAWDFIL
jgi:Ca2+-binding RTX toxin-like protein